MKLKKRYVAALTVVMLIVMTISIHAQETVITDSFDDPALPGWEYTPNVFVESRVLHIEGGGLAFRPGEWGDFNLSVSVRRPVEGEFVITHHTSGAGAYIVVVGQEFISLQRESDGALEELASTPAAIPSTEWFPLEVKFNGDEQSIFINGDHIISFSGADPLPPGAIGFESLGDMTVELDDLAIISEAGIPPTEAEQETAPPPASQTQDTGNLVWVRTGGPLGGLGYDIRMHPDNPDRMYVTDSWAGVFISDDGGVTWYPSNSGITARAGESGDAIPVFCLTIDPHNPDIIWVGTQHARGVFKSIDGGQTWSPMHNGIQEIEGISFRGFTVDPQNSDTVYGAAEIASFAWAGEEQVGREFDRTKGVVYKTTDGGKNWAAIWRGDNLARYVWVDPRDSNVLYISTGIFDREAANSDHTTNTPGGEGILKSTDGGKSWQSANDGIDNLYVGSLFMHPQNPDILLAATGNNAFPDGAGVYLTSDGGAYWQLVTPQEGFQAVEFSVSDPQIAYAGHPGAIYRSEDGGQTWQRVSGEEQDWGSPGVQAGFPIDFQVDPRDPQRIFANNYGGGNFLSQDGGQTWVDASKGYTGAQARDIAIDPQNPAQVYVAARSGIFSSSDGGNVWSGLNFPPARALEWNAVAVEPSDSEHVLAANNWMPTIWESQDSGQSWGTTDLQVVEGKAVRTIAFAPSDAQVVYAGIGAFFSAGSFADHIDGLGIFASNDGGQRWEAVNDSLSDSAHVVSLAVSPQDPQVVVAATTNHGLLLTENGGESWAQINDGLPESPSVYAVEFHPQDPQQLYAGLRFAGLYHSSDGSESWQLSSAGLNPEATVTDILFDPNDSEIIYLSDRGSGVYRSSDGGQAWHALNQGLRTRAVNALTLSAAGDHLYAATEGEGVFRLDLNGTPPQGVAESESPTPEPIPTQSVEPGEIIPDETEEPGGGISCLNGAFPIGFIGFVWMLRWKKCAST